MTQEDMDEVWMVVTPHNPVKKRSNLINIYDRIEMVRLAIGEENIKLKASDLEVNLPTPNYTANTLTYLREKHPEKEFFPIMGSDNLETLHKWKNYQSILENHGLLVYPRPGYSNESEILYKEKVQITHAPMIEISSSQIRKNIREGKSIRYLVPDVVIEFITKGGLYD
ncbi:MAG: nicotinate-nucleotide adenylyltransferase [Sphingobacteriales bacterium]